MRFGAWIPDAPDTDSEQLSLVRNVAPAYGAFRLINRPTQIMSTATTAEDINGSYSHLVTEERTNMLLKPNGQVGTANGWTGPERDEVTNLHVHLDEQVASTSDFIQSAADPTSDAIRFSLESPERDPADSSDHKMHMKYRTQNMSGTWTLDWDLWHAGSGASVLSAANQETDTSNHDWTTVSYTLSSAEVDAIGTAGGNGTLYTNPVKEDYDGLQFRLVSDGDSTDTVLRTDADIEIGGFDGNSGETEDLWDLIDQDADHIASDSLALGASRNCTFGIEEFTGTPDTTGTWTCTMQYRTASGAANKVTATMELKMGSTTIATDTQTVTHDSGFGTYTYNLTTDEKESITDWSDLRVEFTGTRIGTGTGGHRLDVKEFDLTFPAESSIQVAWVQFEAPDDNITIVDDTNEFYIGTHSDLKRSNGSTFDTLTRSGSDYGLTTTNPSAWDFCSFGQTVIATNFGDEVQVKLPSDSLFSDLITSTLRPNARFCMHVAGHLVLGDINDNAGSATGQSDEIWWSALDDPANFLEGDLETGSDRQLIYHTPGRITALTGRGDYGYVWKRDSIVRLDYVGDDLVFDINVISNGIGCPHPQSIVEVGADVFFCTGYSFAKLGPSGIDGIGDQAFNKYIFDETFESYAMHQADSDDPVEQDQFVVGAFDRFTGNVWWFYYNRNESSSRFMKPLAVCYNTRTGVATHIDMGDEEIQTIAPNMNLQSAGGPWRGILMATAQDDHYVRTFVEDSTFAATIRTSVLSSLSFTGEENQDIHLHGIRPIFRSEKSGEDGFIPGGFTVNVYYGDTPEVNENSDSQSFVYSDANEEGIIPLNNIRANYFMFEYVVPSFVNMGLRDFQACEYHFTPGGMK